MTHIILLPTLFLQTEFISFFDAAVIFLLQMQSELPLSQQQQQAPKNLPFLTYPLFVCAPMVEQSELPFRLLTRRYGTNLCYTPMLHSKMMTSAKNYKQEHFTTCPEDRPLVAQICGNDPETMVKAAKMLEGEVDAIDINLGCPQGIARKGHYGSYLLEQPELIEKIVKALVENVKVPIFCKIRILKDEEKTMALASRIAQAGCSLLTVHGRTKEQNKDRVGSCNWEIIRKIKQSLSIPVVANGGIYRFGDVSRCLSQANVDGVMSSESLLENPALFSSETICSDKLALEYVDLAEKYPGANDSCIRAHLFKILFTGLSIHTDLRERLVKAQGIETFRAIAQQMQARRADIDPKEKLGWYLRYWKKPRPDYLEGISQEKEEEQEKKELAKSEEAEELPKAEQQACGI